MGHADQQDIHYAREAQADLAYQYGVSKQAFCGASDHMAAVDAAAQVAMGGDPHTATVVMSESGLRPDQINSVLTTIASCRSACSGLVVPEVQACEQMPRELVASLSAGDVHFQKPAPAVDILHSHG